MIIGSGPSSAGGARVKQSISEAEWISQGIRTQNWAVLREQYKRGNFTVAVWARAYEVTAYSLSEHIRKIQAAWVLEWPNPSYVGLVVEVFGACGGEYTLCSAGSWWCWRAFVRPGHGRKLLLSLEDQLLMTVMCLRQGRLEEDLGYMFGMSASTVSRVVSEVDNIFVETFLSLPPSRSPRWCGMDCTLNTSQVSCHPVL